MPHRGKSRIWQPAGVAAIAAISTGGRRAAVSFAGQSIVARGSDRDVLFASSCRAVMASSLHAQAITWAGGVSIEAAMSLLGHSRLGGASWGSSHVGNAPLATVGFGLS